MKLKKIGATKTKIDDNHTAIVSVWEESDEGKNININPPIKLDDETSKKK